MTIVKIHENAPTLDNQILPKHDYLSCYFVLEDNLDNVGVVINKHSYWFDKKYIERSI